MSKMKICNVLKTPVSKRCDKDSSGEKWSIFNELTKIPKSRDSHWAQVPVSPKTFSCLKIVQCHTNRWLCLNRNKNFWDSPGILNFETKVLSTGIPLAISSTPQPHASHELKGWPRPLASPSARGKRLTNTSLASWFVRGGRLINT